MTSTDWNASFCTWLATEKAKLKGGVCDDDRRYLNLLEIFGPQIWQAAYQAGRAAAVKDAHRWQELCAAIRQSLSHDPPKHVPFFGMDEGLFAYVQTPLRTYSRIKVVIYYRAPSEIRDDLDAALDLIEGIGGEE